MNLGNIQMTGIDHSAAGVKVREQFSFTSAQAERAMAYIKEQPEISGCVLLSTCNRMELWVSVQEGAKADLPALLGGIRQIGGKAAEYRAYFTDRQGEEAAEHLFYLAAGLKSRVVGEDQILTQVKDAVKKSREMYCTDTLLEVLFRHAVTAGKEVKTKAQALHGDFSAARCAVESMKRMGYVFAGKKCLVIGNGQMGKITAQALRSEGAAVTVTVRQYRSGMVEIPRGCGRINYGERYERIPECDLIVSATVSPNLTIRRDELARAREAAGSRRPQIYIDLAVPRDIEEEIAALEGVVLYDIDSFQSSAESAELMRQRRAAEEILAAGLAEFKNWCQSRELVPRIQRIGRRAAEDICWRMERGLKRLSRSDREQIGRLLEESSARTVDKLLFALRDELPREELCRCVEILEKIRY